MNDLSKQLLLSILTLFIAGTADPSWAGGNSIFSDDFESGDTSAWSETFGGPEPSCALGPPIQGEQAGDLGPAPSGPFVEIACLEIRDDADLTRDREVAFSGIPIPRDLGLLDTSELVLLGPGDRHLAAQFNVLSRWASTVDDTSAPIRWLQVAVRPRVDPGQTVSYALRHYPGLDGAIDPWALTVNAEGALWRVSTGLADYLLDPSHPALIQNIAVDLDDDGLGLATVYQHQSGAGPRLDFDPGSGTVQLDSSVAGRLAVDDFRWIETGPVRAVAALDGHFVAPGGSSLCSIAAGPAYERFTYTAIFVFERARRGFELELHIRNTCSDAMGNDWTDEAIEIRRASWELPLPSLSQATVLHGGAGGIGQSTAGFVGTTVVEQRKGAGDPWARRARVTRDGVELETAETFELPILGLADDDLLVASTLAWMRFREPQALAVEGNALSLQVISEPQIVGEAKGIWNHGRVVFEPLAEGAGTVSSGSAAQQLSDLRAPLRAELERGLMPRAPRSRVNEARLLASLGNGSSSPIKTTYLDVMNTFHEQTVSPGGQWWRAKTFGSQIWPDVQFDPWQVDAPASPADNDVVMNYWNPSGAELLEYLRSGEPRWVWDFALPQSRLQMFTAYVNIGNQLHGNRNGVAATSGGSGDGQWHRSSFGSDDYSYNMGMHLAYALRPSPAMRDRFAQAGTMIAGRYSLPKAQEDQREQYVNQIDVTRQVIQHFEMLANCAEFVPGSEGVACHTRLLEIVDELARDNLRAGILCQGDVPSAVSCDGPQRFMVAALFYNFFHRYLLNWGDVDGLIRDALVGDALNYYQQGMSKLANSTDIDPNGEWAALLDCPLINGGTGVGTCSWVQVDGTDMLWHNKAHTVSLLLMAHELDPSIGLCQISRNALEHPSTTLGWGDNQLNQAGWWKGAAQQMQSAVFGVGLYDVCSDP